MEEIYRILEEKIKAAGYPYEISGMEIYDEICDEIDGKETKEFPVTPVLEKAKPVFKVLPGWKCDIRGITKYEDLPENARNYIEFIEKEIGFPITIVSNGPKRSEIIYR